MSNHRLWGRSPVSLFPKAFVFLSTVFIIVLIGCDADDYKLDPRDNPYDPGISWGSRAISIEGVTVEEMGDYPSWSYDGSKIAYYHPGEQCICIVEEGGSAKPLPYTSEDQYSEGICVKWSPVEDRLAYIQEGFDGVGISVRPYPDTDPPSADPITMSDGYYTSLVWSPDGKEIAYVDDIDCMLQIIEVADPGNKRVLDKLTKPITFALVTDWSPDGRHLMAISTGKPRAYKVDIATRDVDLLEIPGSRVCMYAVWSKDGSRILYVTRNFGRSELWMMDSDGNQAAVLTKDTLLTEDTFLFDITLDRDSLDEGMVSVDLQLKFSDKATILSGDAFVESRGDEWQIIDASEGQTYTIKRGAEVFKVYSSLARNAEFIDSINWSRHDESDLLFVGSLDYFGRNEDKDIFLMRMELK
jgi:WD40 repeat protein